MNQRDSHSRISPTAKFVAYYRQMSDIPYSKDIVDVFNVENAFQHFIPNNKATYGDIFAPLLEVRYKSIQYALEQANISQVLEFASGISLRGLAMTKDPNLVYVETDLPELNQEKVDLVSKVMERNNIANRENLFFHAVNVLSSDEIESALGHFNAHKPLAVVHEGLFQYLTRDEKQQAAKNIYRLLKRYGGLWITPDLEMKSSFHAKLFTRSQGEEMMSMIKNLTGRDFLHNAFDDEKDVLAFFQNLGFVVEWHPQMNESIALSTLNAKQLSTEALDALHGLRLWILRVT